MTKTTRFASALFLSLAALGAAHAATAAEQLPGDKYGYEFRSHDAFTDGARAGKPDPYVDGARTVAGLDRSGVSTCGGLISSDRSIGGK